MSDFGQALHAPIEALGRSAIPYPIGGSMASGIHGIYRTSLDVDLVADIHSGQIARFIQELGGEFYADAGSYKFDIFPLSSDPFHQSQFSRREVREIVLGAGTLAVAVATAEDTLLMKLVVPRGRRGIRAAMERCGAASPPSSGTRWRRPADTDHSTTWNSIHELAVRGVLPPRSVAMACR